METKSSARNETIYIYFAPTDKIDSTTTGKKNACGHIFVVLLLSFCHWILTSTVFGWVDIMLSPYIFIQSKARIS